MILNKVIRNWQAQGRDNNLPIYVYVGLKRCLIYLFSYSSRAQTNLSLLILVVGNEVTDSLAMHKGQLEVTIYIRIKYENKILREERKVYRKKTVTGSYGGSTMGHFQRT